MSMDSFSFSSHLFFQGLHLFHQGLKKIPFCCTTWFPIQKPDFSICWVGCTYMIKTLKKYWLMVHILCIYDSAWGVNMLFFFKPGHCNVGPTWWTVSVSYTWYAILACAVWILSSGVSLAELIIKHNLYFCTKQVPVKLIDQFFIT